VSGKFRYFQPLLILIALPAVGIVCSLLIDLHYDVDGIQAACAALDFRAKNPQACFIFEQIALLRDASWISLAASLAIPIVYFVIAAVIGQSRFLVAVVFSLLVKLSILLTIGLVLVDTAIVVFSAYLGFAFTVSRVPVGILAAVGLVGLGGVVAAFTLLMSLLSLGRRLELPITGKKLAGEEHAKLIGIVSTIAARMGARPPDHIIVGLDPNFFVTSANIVLVGEGGKLTGETLYLSAPLLRLLNPREFIAVVAHELGHFAGRDTIYSSRFAPIYEQLTRSLSRLSHFEQLSDLAKLPGLALLSILMAVFAGKERKISRTRELEADKKAVTIAPAESLISALVKVSLIAQRWVELRKMNIDALNEGKIIGNLCDVFADYVGYSLDRDRTVTSRLIAALENDKISHPTDTHPTNAERAANLDVKIDAVAAEALADVRAHLASPESRILPGAVEEELTILEHKVLLHLGLAQLPSPDPNNAPAKPDEHAGVARHAAG
jgi:Zn-dependent protease with chaperone function